MKRSLLMPAFVVLVALAGRSPAYAQTSTDNSSAAPATTTNSTTSNATPSGDATTTPGTTTTQTQTPAQTPAEAAPPPAQAQAAAPSAAYLAARERGKSAAAKETASIDKQLTTVAKQVDDQATRSGDATVAGRLASDFGVSSDALLAEKARYNVGWGDLMIGHTLASNTLTGVTIDEVMTMRTTDAMGWGQIAGGLDLKLGSVVSAMKSESKVAGGSSRADGKPAKIAVAPDVPPASTGSSGMSGSSGSPGGMSGDAGTAGK